MLMLFYLKNILCVSLVFLLSITTVYAGEKESNSLGIVINLPSRMLELYSGNTLIKEYSVAIGKPATPTPIGTFSIFEKEINPTWVPPGRGIKVLPGPDNPLGYRWLGFFNLYGVHGTNAPWSIGQAVSNGCIRMKEENVEELFEIVKYGTPVTITYDRIKIKIDDSGQATLGIYPDVYKRKGVALAEVNDKLAVIGIKGIASEELLQRIIKEGKGEQVPFATLHHIKVNDIIVPEWAVTMDNGIYVPVWAVAKEVSNSIVWNETTQKIWQDKRVVNGVVKGDIIYIHEEDIPNLFGGEKYFSKAENTLEIKLLTVFVNDRIFSTDVKKIENVLAIPALSLVESLGKKYNYDSSNKSLLVNGKSIPIVLIDNQPYIKIAKIQEAFNAHVFWDEEKYSIEITYPAS